ncbi:MAG TPA: ABC transporter permease [Tepidisphaeraceae bacterium]|nr:ABC transporter permease [Tepidisphaeraceae bacterium]
MLPRWLWSLVLCLLVPVAARDAAAQQNVNREQLQRDFTALTSHLSRVIGSPGYEQAAAYIESQLSALGSGIQWRRHEYPVMAPVTTSATLTIAGGATEPIYPFWPADVRLCSTPAEGITGRAIYCGNASYSEIPPKRVHGQIAVVEASAGEFWTHAPYFGARAVLVLGSTDTTHIDLRAHDLLIPVDLPRFYVPPGPLADALRAERIDGEIALRAEVNWRRVMARNYYALVKGRTSGDAALTFSAPFESSSLVPDLAPGASQATQAACGLAILRDAAANPLDRPVMVAFTGADSIQFLGSRNMFLALSDVPALWGTQLLEIRKEFNQARRDLQRLRDPETLHPTRDRSALERIVRIIETELSLDQEELFRLRRKPEAMLAADDRAAIERLSDNQIMLNQLRYGFQQDPPAVIETLPEQARRFIERAMERLGGEGSAARVGSAESGTIGLIAQLAGRERELTDRVDLYRWLASAMGRDADPSARVNNSRLIELLVALDFTDGGSRVGPLYWGWFQRTPGINQIQDHRDWFAQRNRELAANNPDAAWLASIKRIVDFSTLSGAEAPQSYLAASMPIGSEMCQAWGIPGISMITLDDPRLPRDTPTDTPQRVQLSKIYPQLEATWLLFRRAWSDPTFKGQPEHKWMRGEFRGQVVGTAVGRPVPDLPRGGFLATYYYAKSEIKKIPELRGPEHVPYTLGIRRSEVRDCDAEGRYRFEGIPRLAHSSKPELLMFAIRAYRVAPDTGEITGCSDLGRQSTDLKLYADLEKTVIPDPFRTVVFACEAFTLVGLYDPRFLQTLSDVILLDARRNAEPQRYNALIRDKLMAGFVEPGTRNQLIFRFGNVGNRLLLINAPPASEATPPATQPRTPNSQRDAPASGGAQGAEGHGFTAQQLNDLGPLALITARDFWRLDDRRIRQYARAGVTSSLIDAMHAEARDQIARAERALEQNDGAALMNQANGAWANNARVYAAVDALARDVVRAAIFLLLLCVPFAFCMERLLIGTPNVYKQIAWGCTIFALMAAALWSFHPAFTISSSPLIIILSFAIIFMSIVVIGVVYSKFDTELKRLRSGRGTPPGGGFARASVLSSAVLLGIANMRKRKFRTALTALTIVLITFAVLCFTSATRYVGTQAMATGEPANHPGLMLRQRGYRPISPVTVENLRPLLPADARLVERWWNVDANEPKQHVHVDAGEGRIFAAGAALGLSPGESELSAIEKVLGREQFARLERGERDIIFLPHSAADELKVREGDVVHLAGHRLTVAGLFDPTAFEEKALALSGEPLSPLLYTVGALDASGRELRNLDADSFDLESGGGSSEATGYEHLPASRIVVVPAAISRMMPNGSLRSIEVRLKDQAEVEQIAEALSRRFSLAMFAGYDDGVRLVWATSLSTVSGAGQVAIPMAIAGLIIFNTMLGSIAERKREIHVYTSLGLAPLHVGALFVAEALTYGLIGTVVGYVLGQGVGTALLKLGWLGDVTLNYSGTSAILTMGLILLVVLLSALVPARVASKIAAPSIDRSWSVPAPTGDVITAQLPFTINRTAADGALAYLADFFEAHREGSIGKFSSGEVQVLPPTDQDPSRGLNTLIWLTPFDLGVRQDLTLTIHPGEYPDIFEVEVRLKRLSGDDGSWHRMNRTFLTELRQQFLQWRSLTPQAMTEYVEKSRQLFATAPPASEPVASLS